MAARSQLSPLSGAKRPRSPSRSRSPSPDPDGSPALIRQMIDRRPETRVDIEKLIEASVQRHASQSLLLFAGNASSGSHQAADLGSPSAPEHEGSSSRSDLKGKGKATASGPLRIGHSSPHRARSTHAAPDLPRHEVRFRAATMTQRPPTEPLHLHSNRSFVKNFNSPFKNSLEIPVEFWLHIPVRSTNSVIIFGDSVMGFEVLVEQINGKCFFTEGWPIFVGAERISRHDVAVFSWLETNRVGMRLYGPNGAQRPMSRRPPYGHPELDDFEAPAAPAHAPVHNVFVPHNVLNMVYEFGPGLQMNGNIMQTLANVWHNGETNFPLYAFKLTRSQVGPSAQFYFARTFSRYFKYRTAVRMFVADGVLSHAGILVRHIKNPDMARIVTGWKAFARWGGFQEGETYVARVFETPAGAYEIRFFRAG